MPGGIPRVMIVVMKVGVSLPEELIEFADAEASRRQTTRSGLIADLLHAERVRREVSDYIDRNGWDVVADEESWRRYQRGRMKAEYESDEW